MDMQRGETDRKKSGVKVVFEALNLVTKARTWAFLLLLASSISSAKENLNELARPILVDGELDDWQGQPFETLGCNLPYEASFSGIFYSGWNTDGLYFAARVYDDQLYSAYSDASLWRNQDCLEIFLDTRGLDWGIKNPMSRKGRISLDYFTVRKTDGSEEIVDDSDTRIRYSDHEWQIRDDKIHYSNTLHELRSDNVEGWFEMEFSGTGIAMTSARFPTGGLYDVYLDGEKKTTIDLFSIRWWDEETLFDSGPIIDGNHVIRVQSVSPRKTGVLHMLVRPTSDDTISFIANTSEGNIEDRIKVATKRTSDGWNIEGMIPWSEMDGFNPVSGKSIRFGYKLYDRDEENEKEFRTLGLRRHGSGTDVAWIAHNPDRFPKVQLSDKRDDAKVDFHIKEIAFQDGSLVEIDAVAPVDSITNNFEALTALSLWQSEQKIKSYPLLKSSGRRFYYVKRYEPLSIFKGEDDVLNFSLRWEREVSGKTQTLSQGSQSIRTRIKAALEKIDSKLPLDEIDRLPDYRKSRAMLYRQVAQELTRYLSGERNRSIRHYNLLPFYETPSITEAYIDTFIRHAQLWMTHEEISKEFADRYYHQAWLSKADGSWQFFKLELPKDFDAKKAYPINLYFHNRNMRQYSRIRELASDIHNINNFTTGEIPLEPEILLRLHGRGNNFKRIGDEEFEYALSWVKEKFPLSANDIRLSGVSSGAKEALRYGTRFIDAASLVDARGPETEAPIDGDVSLLYDNANYFAQLSDDLYDKVSNLQNLPIRITVGANDKMFLGANKLLYRSIKNESQEYRLDIVPDTEHHIPPWKVPELKISPRSLNTVPDAFELKQSSLRYGSAYGFTVTAKEMAWRPFSLSVGGLTGNNWSVAVSNTQSFEIKLDRLNGSQLRSVDLSINGQAVPIRVDEPKQTVVLEKKNGRWGQTSDKLHGKIAKRPKLQGPIGDIEKEGFVIVYGTRNSSTEPILLDRAIRISDELFGSDEGEWSGGRFIIKRDTEVTNKDMADHNLWLIGNASENAIVPQMIGELPFRLDDQGIHIGNREWRGKELFLELIYQNPIEPEHYVYIEAGQSPECYYADILSKRAFDFAITRFDAKKNPLVARGVFDNYWKLDSAGAKVWKH